MLLRHFLRVLFYWIRLGFFSLFILLQFFLIPQGQASTDNSLPIPELVIYTYDSFVAPGGLGPTIFPLFEKKFNCRIRALSSGEGGQLLNRLELDSHRKKAGAHLIVGIDQHVWERAQPWIETWGDWKPNGYSEIDTRLRTANGFLPYDFGILTLIANQASVNNFDLKKPLKLSDLLRPELKRNFILQDPRTSTPGLNFLLFTHHILGQSAWEFWGHLKSQWLTLSPGWSSAYGLFLRNEAPLVWSYLTSQAYHEEKKSQQPFPYFYKAVLFQEGQPIQIEGAAWVKGALKTAEQKKLAQAFLEFLISPEVQKEIPRKNWMMPVRKNVELPLGYSHLPRIINQFSLTLPAQKLHETLVQWHRAVQ